MSNTQPQDNLNESENPVAELEALLFIHGEPLSYQAIMDVLEVDAQSLREVVESYREQLSQARRGLTLLKNEDTLQLVTKPKFGDLLQRFIEEDLQESLTSASLETLSLICYLSPAQRSDIEYIRGVNASFILRTLSLRGLVDRERGAGGAYVYRPSNKLLRTLGVKSVEELPEYETYSSLDELLRRAERGGSLDEANNQSITQ